MLNNPNPKPQSIDIFCRVIDNFGDIGVCWRLAKALRTVAPVRLWVDHLASFAKLLPHLNTDTPQQWVSPVFDWNQPTNLAAMLTLTGNVTVFSQVQTNAIEVRLWSDDYSEEAPADFVIEAFACDLPKTYQANMHKRTRCWLNVDYLSAEKWVESCHGLPSAQKNGVAKFFFFPGFTSATGGLIREPYLLSSLKQLQDSSIYQQQFLQQLLDQTAQMWRANGAQLITLFCYPNAPIEAFLAKLSQQSEQHFILCIPTGVFEHLVAAQYTNIYIQRLPFIDQAYFDMLLACADLNIVRGEDSFVRAQWAGKPFIWHIYQQTENTHLEKLNAWLERVNAPDFVRDAQYFWNQAEHSPISDQFIEVTQWLAWQDYSEKLQQQLKELGNLSDNLLNFFAKKVKTITMDT